jgi:hypothetical protein
MRTNASAIRTAPHAIASEIICLLSSIGSSSKSKRPAGGWSSRPAALRLGRTSRGQGKDHTERLRLGKVTRAWGSVYPHRIQRMSAVKNTMNANAAKPSRMPISRSSFMGLLEIPNDEQPGHDASCDDRESNSKLGSKDFFRMSRTPTWAHRGGVAGVPGGPCPVLRGEAAGLPSQMDSTAARNDSVATC